LGTLKNAGLCFTGKSADGRRMETLELPERYFFFASQFHGSSRVDPIGRRLSIMVSSKLACTRSWGRQNQISANLLKDIQMANP